VIEKMQLILAQANMTLDDVVSTTVYLQNLSDYAGMNIVYSEFFKRDFPARATVRADLAGDGLLVEISGIAVKG
jgi:2-iminobutanoate/2-iminopropanoate deaminase